MIHLKSGRPSPSRLQVESGEGDKAELPASDLCKGSRRDVVPQLVVEAQTTYVGNQVPHPSNLPPK